MNNITSLIERSCLWSGSRVGDVSPWAHSSFDDHESIVWVHHVHRKTVIIKLRHNFFSFFFSFRHRFLFISRCNWSFLIASISFLFHFSYAMYNRRWQAWKEGKEWENVYVGISIFAIPAYSMGLFKIIFVLRKIIIQLAELLRTNSRWSLFITSEEHALCNVRIDLTLVYIVLCGTMRGQAEDLSFYLSTSARTEEE